MRILTKTFKDTLLVRDTSIVADTLIVGVEDYEDFYGISEVICLEYTEEKGLMLYVWADNLREDPTHEISLEGARKKEEFCNGTD